MPSAPSSRASEVSVEILRQIASSALIGLLAMTAFAQDPTLPQQAEAAWAERDQSGQTEQAIALWQKALQSHPSDVALYIKVSKACGRAVRHASSSKDRKRWEELAKTYAARAVELDPKNPEALTAYGEALGQWARDHKLHGLGAVKQAVDALERSLEIRPQQPFAHMLLAEMYSHAPSMISVGDKKKGFHHAKMGAELPEAYSINHLVLARLYLERGERDAARQHLQTILSLTPPPDAIPETRADQDTAREMLKNL